MRRLFASRIGINEDLPEDSGLASVAGSTTAEQICEQIIEFIGSSPTDIDELVRECHCSGPAMMAALLELELAGRVLRLTGNRGCRLFNELG